jgi:hypothetical protein
MAGASAGSTSGAKGADRAVMDHLSAGDSTHGSTPQAASASLLRILRLKHPYIQLHRLTHDLESPVVGTAPVEAEHASLIAAQASLVAYLTQVSQLTQDARLDDIALAPSERAHPQIKSVVEMIALIHASQDFTHEEKQLIFMQMTDIAQTHPGAQWDDNHARWSSNAIYNKETKKNECVAASVAETLSLVCATLSEEREESKKKAFVLSLGKRLLDLQQAHLCSTGRQHELLCALNGTYQVDGSTLHLPSSTTTFVYEALSDYLGGRLRTLAEEDYMRLLVDWLDWSQAGEEKECPLLTFLRQGTPYTGEIRAGEPWYIACVQYLKTKMLDLGLNPDGAENGRVISDVMSSIQDIGPAYILSTGAEVIAVEILKAQPVMCTSRQVELNGLVVLYNRALTETQDKLRRGGASAWTELRQELSALYTHRSDIEHLLSCQDIQIFIGAEEGEFQRACQAFLRILLKQYQADPSLKQDAPEEYKSLRDIFLRKLTDFKAKSSVELVSNGFAWIKTYIEHHDFVSIQSIMNRLTRLNAEGQLSLTDEILAQWLRESTDLDAERLAEGGQVVHISPYQINRIVLHALHVDPDAWTPTFKITLDLVLNWLSAPGGATLAEETLKRSYPNYLISNLKFIHMLWQELEAEEEHQALKQQVLAQFNQENFRYGVRDNFLNIVCKFDIISLIVSLLRPEQLARLIHNQHHLNTLFTLSPEMLSLAHRDLILEAVRPRLGELIQNSGQLQYLLTLPLENLSLAHRDLILKAVRPRLGELIQNSDELWLLLNLPLEKLSLAHRDLILESLRPRLGELIPDSNALMRLSSQNFEAAAVFFDKLAAATTDSHDEHSANIPSS